ncbi:peptidoglycan editing factor PgeF [Desulfococcaceae bacterium HSG9]|nr:peptidoglycan editing factor PgeF [Desulfococcaceae bacterium HSG9]
MISKEIQNVSFLQFPNFEPFAAIRHAIFTRRGGSSRGAFGSLNISFGVGDKHTDVLKNRKLIARCLESERLVFVQQVHGSDVLILKNGESENDAALISETPQTADALITDIAGLNLVIQVADCQPVLLYEPVRNVIANVHSGWRGSVLNIIADVVKIMERRFGGQAENMIAGVGPSLGPCCAEFVNYRQELPESFWKYRIGQNHFDFQAISKHQLIEAGVLEANISLSRICTRCNLDRFYSYRGEKVTGRFAAVIGLQEARI